MNVLELPGANELREQEQKILESLATTLGEDFLRKVWKLYQETRIVEGEGLWGIPNPGRHFQRSGCALHFRSGRKLCNGQSSRHDNLVQAGLVHDAGKREEVEEIRAGRSYKDLHKENFERNSLLVGEETARLAEMCGHSAMENVLLASWD